MSQAWKEVLTNEYAPLCPDQNLPLQTQASQPSGPAHGWGVGLYLPKKDAECVLAPNISPSSIIFIPIIKDAPFKAKSFNRLLLKHTLNMNELIELISYLIGS